MSNLSYRRAISSDQRGFALVVTLLALVVLLVVGVGVLQTSVAGLRASANDRMSKSALAIAESGIEYAREQLRTQLKSGPITLSQTLARAANGGTLVNATQFSAFSGSTGIDNYTTNAPLVLPTSFRSGTFQVFLTNDRKEPASGGNQAASVQSTTDTNKTIMVTSLGSGPGGSLAAVQEQLKVFDEFLPGLGMPATVVLPGPNIDFEPFQATAADVDGCDLPTKGTAAEKTYPTIAVSSQAALTTALSFFDSHNQGNKYKDKYDACDPKGSGAAKTFENFLLSTPGSKPNPYEPNTSNVPAVEGDHRLVEVAYLKKLVATIKSVADYTSTGATVPLGTASAPAISVIDNPGGEVRYSGSPTGYGILLVTGQLTFTGTPEYHGLILCIGDGRFLYKGNGTSHLYGSVLVANINNPYNAQYVGVPYYHDNGGGNHTQEYDSSALSSYAAPIMPLQRLTFQQLR